MEEALTATADNKDFDAVVEFVVESTKAVMQAKKDGKFGLEDVGLLVPPLSKLGVAVKGIKTAFKDLDVAQIKAAAEKEIEALGALSGKAAVYVEEGFNIATALLAIYTSFKKITSAPASAVPADVEPAQV